jgi:hypothetical protein
MPSVVFLIPLGTLHRQTGIGVAAGFRGALVAVSARALPLRVGSDVGRAAR